MDFLIYFLFFMACIMVAVNLLGLLMVMLKKDNIFAQILLSRCKEESGVKLRFIQTAVNIILLMVAGYFYSQEAKIYALILLLLVHGVNSLFEKVLSEII